MLAACPAPPGQPRETAIFNQYLKNGPFPLVKYEPSSLLLPYFLL